MRHVVSSSTENAIADMEVVWNRSYEFDDNLAWIVDGMWITRYIVLDNRSRCRAAHGVVKQETTEFPHISGSSMGEESQDACDALPQLLTRVASGPWARRTW